MAVLLGLSAGLVYGSADFVGGLVTRRAGAVRVVVLSQAAGLLLLLALLTVLGGTASPSALGWGAAAGVGGGTGVALLYRGLARGRMGVVAPVTAVGAAAVPVLFGLATGERPSQVALAGVVLALVAVVLVSATPEPLPAAPAGTVPPLPPLPPAGRPPGRAVPAVDGPPAHDPAGGPSQSAPTSLLRRPGLPEALGAGVGFGVFFILLSRAPASAGLWPLVGARLSSVGLLALAALLLRRDLRPPAGTVGGILLAGGLDMVANALYLLATRHGLLSLVAVLTSLYPASTVLLARILLDERFTGPQLAGLLLAVTGVALIGLG